MIAPSSPNVLLPPNCEFAPLSAFRFIAPSLFSTLDYGNTHHYYIHAPNNTIRHAIARYFARHSKR